MKKQILTLMCITLVNSCWGVERKQYESDKIIVTSVKGPHGYSISVHKKDGQYPFHHDFFELNGSKPFDDFVQSQLSNFEKLARLPWDQLFIKDSNKLSSDEKEAIRIMQNMHKLYDQG